MTNLHHEHIRQCIIGNGSSQPGCPAKTHMECRAHILKKGLKLSRSCPGAIAGTMQVVQEHTTFTSASFASESKLARWIRHHLNKHNIDSLML
jgi:kynurenine formamidase